MIKTYSHKSETLFFSSVALTKRSRLAKTSDNDITHRQRSFICIDSSVNRQLVDKFQHTSINAFDLLADILLFRKRHADNYQNVPRNIVKNSGYFHLRRRTPPSWASCLSTWPQTHFYWSSSRSLFLISTHKNYETISVFIVAIAMCIFDEY